MSWKETIEELKRRKQLAYRMGGEENVRKQHELGKLTARERIGRLLDPGSFRERGILAGDARYVGNRIVDLTPCPLLIGIGNIMGKQVTLLADDFTIKGASVGDLYKAKLAYVLKMTRELRLPAVRLLDGAGGNIKEILKIGYVKFPTLPDSAMKDL